MISIKVTRFLVAAILFLVATTPSAVKAGTMTRCDQIAKDVRESVAREPSKVLMLVEDALVINESCACEIIKAAIQASNADKAMSKQIVQTAVAVAPKMSAIIFECAEAVAAGSGGVGVKSEKSGNSLGGPVAEPKDGVSGQDGDTMDASQVAEPKDKEGKFSSANRADIRGVYLMQPAVGGLISAGTSKADSADDKNSGANDSKINPRKPRKHTTTPVSNSVSAFN
jgi:hypothetical protein